MTPRLNTYFFESMDRLLCNTKRNRACQRVIKTKEQKFVYLFHFSIKPTVQLTKNIFGKLPKFWQNILKKGQVLSQTSLEILLFALRSAFWEIKHTKQSHRSFEINTTFHIGIKWKTHRRKSKVITVWIKETIKIEGL